jgi:hypothetical protein
VRHSRCAVAEDIAGSGRDYAFGVLAPVGSVSMSDRSLGRRRTNERDRFGATMPPADRQAPSRGTWEARTCDAGPPTREVPIACSWEITWLPSGGTVLRRFSPPRNRMQPLAVVRAPEESGALWLAGMSTTR